MPDYLAERAAAWMPKGLSEEDRLRLLAQAAPVPNRAMAQEIPERRPEAHEAPKPQATRERFDQLSSLEKRKEADPGTARAAFTRSLVTHAANAAAFPVTRTARLARAAGFRGQALDDVADLDANEAYAEAESLARQEGTEDTRARHRRAAEVYPAVTLAGGLTGDVLGGFGLEGLAARGAGGALRMAAKQSTNPLLTSGDVAAALKKQSAGMRPESLEHLRGGGEVRGGPVTVGRFPGEAPHIIDGRHRLTVAAERGAPSVKGRVLEYDSEGNAIRTAEDVEIPTGRGFASSQARLAAASMPGAAANEQERAYLEGRQLTDGEALAGLASGATLGAATGIAARGFAGIGSATEAAEKAGAYLKKHRNYEALKRYVGSGYSALNEELRSGKLRPKSAELAADLQVLLSDAARKGHTVKGTVYRGIEIPEEVAQHWIDRGAIKNRSFWSTTGTQSVTEGFTTPYENPGMKRVILELEMKSGVPVGRSYSGGSAEDEVLMNSGKNWLIKGHERLPDGRMLIRAREVDELPDGVTPALSFDGNSGPGLGVFAGSARGAYNSSERNEEERERRKRSSGTAGSTSRNQEGSR